MIQSYCIVIGILRDWGMEARAADVFVCGCVFMYVCVTGRRWKGSVGGFPIGCASEVWVTSFSRDGGQHQGLGAEEKGK